MAKKKSRPMKIGPAGLVVAVGVACAGGGYFVGRNNAWLEQGLAALTGAGKTAAPTTQAATPPAEPKRAEAPHAIKSADKAGLARLSRSGEAKSETRAADAKAAEPRPPADIPSPPAKPEMARSEPVKPDPVKAEVQQQPAPLAFALLDREITQSGEDGERVTLSLNFENLAGKPIRAFEGVVKFTDQQDANIYSSKISVSALISENGALHWEQHVDARKLDGKGKRLVSEDKANLRAIFLLKKIFFVDGSVQKYAMPAKAAQAG